MERGQIMNERQYDIVKVMQALDIRAHRFAKACHESAAKIRAAYSSGSYGQFKEYWKEFGDTDQMKETMGL